MYLLFHSDLPQMVENIDDVPYSARRFFNLGGQIDASHGHNLEEEQHVPGTSLQSLQHVI